MGKYKTWYSLMIIHLLLKLTDSEAGGQILVVPVGSVDVGNIKAGFTSSTGGNGYKGALDTDDIPGNDTLLWGANSNTASGYKFKANIEYKDLAKDVINNQLNLGVFTHTNKPITAGTEIKTTILTVELDVVIDGKLVHIKHDINIKHEETPNIQGNPEQSKDIVTIEQSSFSQKINVGGKEYLFVIDGFLDKNGNVVKEVRTWEDGDAPKGQTNYNSFELFASIVSTDPLPKIEGSAFGDDAGSNAIFGADGAAKNNAIVWDNGVAQTNGTTKIVGEYGTLIVDKNGNYEFELNRKTYDSFKDEKTATFKYTVTDADGDTRDSFVNIKLNGAIYENVDTIGRTIEGSESSDIIYGSSGNDYIYGAGGDDSIHAGAGRDVIYGGAGNDTIYTDLSTKNGTTYGDVFIDGGTGYDKLILEGNNDIDLSVIKGKISIKNIEEIDLTQGDHALKNLKLDDVIDLTDGKNELYVKGNLGDKVELDLNEWNVQSTNKGYTEYIGKGEHSTVKLIIDDEIDIHNI
jgi:VCBS repeat-containing protein